MMKGTVPVVGRGNPSVSFVIPCLNEEKTLGEVLRKINNLIKGDLSDSEVEVIVSDNGSTDRSVAIAESLGARVVHCPEKGYGAALQNGIRNAKNEAIIFADADNTYDFLESPKLIGRLTQGYDLVLGSRLQGEIHPGAMPFAHRYLGTPILTFFINLLYQSKSNKISDCNSGFRCFWREEFLKWNVQSKGMEFASEMLVKAFRHGAHIGEVPISLRPDLRERTPHLKTWRDGMRHLLQILSEAPDFFYYAGSSIWLASWLTLILSVLFGPVYILFASVLGLHTMMFALLFSCLGITIFSIGMFLSAKQNHSNKIYLYLSELTEDKLFWYSVMMVALSFAAFLLIFMKWYAMGFRMLSLESETLLLISFSVNCLLLVANCFTVHIMKRI